jgi:AraC-like DNA-binding protein
MINAWHSEHHNNSGYVCAFSADFFGPEIPNAPSLAELPFFQLNGPSILRLSDEKMAGYTQLFDMMTLEAKSENPLSADILRSYLHVLINKARGDLGMQNLDKDTIPHAGVRLVKAFKQMYTADINVIRTGQEIRLKRVSEYAEHLGVSQNYLNDTIRTLTGESAGGLIQKQLMRQATMCLKHSLKNVSEIAYLLGFDDPSYFARFYKRHTGKSPSQVRASSNKL